MGVVSHLCSDGREAHADEVVDSIATRKREAEHSPFAESQNAAMRIALLQERNDARKRTPACPERARASAHS